MLQTMKKGFTLIELLVVITIIGILATGAVTTFTSQMQKARDTTRITDINAMKSAVEQVYQDTGEYPHTDEFFSDVSVYMERLPSDPKHAQPCNSGATAVECAYAYITGPDDNGILYGEYELSTAFENSGNRWSRAEGDSGNDDERLEQWLDVGNNSSSVAADAITTVNAWACVVGWGAAGDGTTTIVINGNPASGECS